MFILNLFRKVNVKIMHLVRNIGFIILFMVSSFYIYKDYNKALALGEIEPITLSIFSGMVKILITIGIFVTLISYICLMHFDMLTDINQRLKYSLLFGFIFPLILLFAVATVKYSFVVWSLFFYLFFSTGVYVVNNYANYIDE